MKSRNNMSIVVVDNENETETLLFWKKRTPEERLSAVEILREQYYAICGYTTIPRIIRELHLVGHAK
ncbi:MAG: hypothetical protein WBF29_01905 [Syntrophobacteria bacterium]